MKAEEFMQRYEAGERDFSGVVIEKEYLGLLKVNLRGAELSGANLEETDLEASILDEADLRGVNLTNGSSGKPS